MEHNVPDVDAHTEFEFLLRWHVDVAGDHAALHFDRAAHRIHCARELRQQPVAGGLDDPAAVLCNLGINEPVPMGLQSGEGAFFVRAHQLAVAGDIGRQDGHELAFYTLRHGPTSQRDRLQPTQLPTALPAD